MKSIVLAVLLGALMAGCTDHQNVEKLQSELEACRQKSEESQVCRQELTAKQEEIEGLKRSIKFAWRHADSLPDEAGEDGGKPSDKDVLLALLIDSQVNEHIATDFVIGNLDMLQNTKLQVGGNPYFWQNKLLDSVLNSASVEMIDPVSSLSQRQALTGYLYAHVKEIFNDKEKLASYYKTFKGPVVLAVLEYQKSQFGDNYSVFRYLEFLRDGFARLLDADTLKHISELVQIEEELNQMNWNELGDDERKKAEQKRFDVTNELEGMSPTLFAYRRYIQSGNDKELIELYLRILDDFLVSAKGLARANAIKEIEHKPENERLVMVAPGWYERDKHVIDDPYDWFALYRTESGLILKKTDLKLTKTVNGASDMDVLDISAPGDEEPILLLRGADWLTEGQVDTLLDNFYFDQPLKNGEPYIALEQGDLLKITIIKAEGKDVQDAVGNSLEHDSFTLQVNSNGRVYKTDQFVNPRYSFFHINWVGDLDRDGKPDFMTTTEIEGRAYSFRFLYLSRDAEEGELFKVYIPADPDGGGC